MAPNTAPEEISKTTMMTKAGALSAAAAPKLIPLVRADGPAFFTFDFSCDSSSSIFSFSSSFFFNFLAFLVSLICIAAGTKVTIVKKQHVMPIVAMIPKSFNGSMGEAKLERKAATVVIVTKSNAVPTKWMVFPTASSTLLPFLISSRWRIVRCIP